VNSTTKTTAAHETSMNFDALADDLAALRRDFVAMMAQLKSGAIDEASEAAESTLGKLGDQASNAYDKARSQGRDSAKMIGRQIEEHPLASLLIAFGAGFVASRFLAR
jgi:ElaB/YqjD/DUF883 family membrane-anchored ribosome-binding protein